MSELDLANLGTQSIEGADQEYEAPSDFRRPPEITPRGEREIVMLDEQPTEEKIYGLKDFQTGEPIPGFSTNLKFKIMGGSQDEKVFYAFLDTRKKPDRNGNDVQDFLRASGFKGRLVTVQDYRDALLNITPIPIEVALTWQPEKCDVCGRRTVKLKDFPLRADGTRHHVATCPDCNEQVGVRAKIRLIYAH